MKRVRDVPNVPAVGRVCVVEPSHPFPADYNDSFETPEAAIRDIIPALTFIAGELLKPLSALRVWDPFFCTGAIAKHFVACGVPNVTHVHEDFYKVISEGRIPPYDVLVTNPPYSADHKEKTLAFAAASKKPYLLLLPAYVSTKAWFGATTAVAPPFFASPSRTAPYAFTHPEGTGKSAPPFASLWIVGGLAQNKATDLVGKWRAARPSLLLTKDATALAEGSLVATGRRKNPKQRRAEKARHAASATSQEGAASLSLSGKPPSHTHFASNASQPPHSQHKKRRF